MKVNQKSMIKDKTLPKSTVIVNKYLQAIEDEGLFAVLVILKTKEITEKYEECAIIQKAVQMYSDKYKELGELPQHINQFKEKRFNKFLGGSSLDSLVSSQDTLLKIKNIKKTINGLSS